MATDVTREALQGYQASIFDSCPYYATSDSAAGWWIGRWMRDPDRKPPRKVTASRGYTYRVTPADEDQFLVSVGWPGNNLATVKRVPR